MERPPVSARFGPITQHVVNAYADGRWPWLSPRAYFALVDVAMEADALEHDALGVES